MSDLLSIGSGGVQVYQRALATTSNNITNTATEGYSRQEATIVDNAPRQLGPYWLGTGSLVETIGRNYDAFIEQSLRTSISDLETQTPLIDYIDRVVDILGSQTTGLTGALDNFFAAARSLSTDAASPELRAGFLSNTEGLCQRLRTLGGQLEVLDTETSEAVRTQLDSINTLAKRLANVNAEMNRRGLLARQAPRLLDERDSLLRELSALVKIRVTETKSGSVNVSIGTTDRRGMIVDGTKARQLEAVIDPQTLDVKLILDPRGNYEVVSGVGSGSLGGLLNFRDQILAPSVAQLDFLAQTIASQFNAVHGLGMDAKGNLGRDLFTIDPVFELRAEASTTDLAVRWEVVNPAETKFHSVRLEFNPDQNVWKATDVETGKAVTGGNDLVINGMRISIDGQSEFAESLLLDASNRPSLGIRSLPEDPRLVAAAAPFRVIEDPLNPSGADATIEWRPDQSDLNPLPKLSTIAQSSSWQTNGNPIDLSAGRPYQVLGALTAGSRDIDLEVVSDFASPVEIEIFTRDGRHIAGSPLADTKWAEIMGVPESGGEGRAPGFVTGATYSRQYKNLSGTLGYLGMSIFRGVRSLPTEFDLINDSGRKIGTEIKPASLLGDRFEPQETPEDGILVKSGALVLNGYALEAFEAEPGDLVSAKDAAEWLNAEIKRINQDPDVAVKLVVEARVVNEVRIKVDDLRLDKGLEIDGSGPLINNNNRPSSAAELVNLINEVFNPESGLYPPTGQRIAYLSGDGQELIIESPEGSPIQIGPENDLLGKSGNALGVTASTFQGRVELVPLREVSLNVEDFDLGQALEIDGQEIDLSDVQETGELVALLQSTLNPPMGQPDPPVRRIVRLSADESRILISSPTGSPLEIGPENLASGDVNNALGVHAGVYSGEIPRTEILLGLGNAGDPSALSRLGFSTHVYLDGQIPEDLIVVATGNSPAKLSIRQTEAGLDLLPNLRDRKFQIRFTSDTAFEIIDVTRVTDPSDQVDLETNGTVVAKRAYSAVQGIHFQGVHFSLSRLPAKGDTYTIDGNHDGIGDNKNILKLAALETSRDLISGALTIAESWHGQINEIGNLGNQARIAQEALMIVNEQAVEARDKVSGVSLDEEAADLVRFQQAYQASARIIQTANQLFDAILQVR